MGEGRVLRGQAAYPDVIRSSVSFSEALPECVPIAAVLSPENRHRVRKPLLAELGKTLCCQPQRLLPRDRTQSSVLSVSCHRTLQTVGVIQELEPPEGLGAQCAAIDGMQGISGDPCDFSVQRPDEDPAAPRTLLTQRGNPDLLRGGPSFQVLACLFGRGQLASGQRSRPGRSAEYLQECSSRDSHGFTHRWQTLQSVEIRRLATASTGFAPFCSSSSLGPTPFSCQALQPFIESVFPGLAGGG